MKHYTLFLLFIVCSILQAQNTYVPYRKSNKSSAFIYLDDPKHISRWMDKPGKRPICEGVRLHAAQLGKALTSRFIVFLQSQQSVKELEILYEHEDSIDFSLLALLNQIESLSLQNDHRDYSQLEKLASLKSLNKLSLLIDSIQQVPVSVTLLATLVELNLCDEKNCSVPSSDIYFHYALNDTSYNYMELNAYSEDIDLSGASVKRHFMSLWPSAEEKKQVFTIPGALPGRNMLNAPDPVAAYKLPASLTPLVQNERQEFEKNVINPIIPHMLVCSDRSVISVPADAFVTKSGNPVGEDVSILYRSVRTPADMMKTGITMFYDTAGQKEMFRTNGMFEIRAFSGNEELVLKKDKEIGIEFRANADTGKFNLYTLNDGINRWTFNNSIVQLPVRTAGYAFMTDKTSFADRYDDLSYTYLLPKNVETGLVEVPTLSNRRTYANALFSLSSKSKQIRKGKTLIRIKVLTELSNNKEGKVVFSIASGTYSFAYSKGVKYPFFPELKPLESMTFEYDGSIKTIEFSKMYKKGKFYTDCRIYYENNADQAIIELKTKDGFVSIPVKAILTNTKGKTRPNQQLKSAYRRYARLLAIKESKFNQTLSRVSYNRSVDTGIYTRVGWVATNGLLSNSSYKLNIRLLGFFNCDQLYRLKHPMIMVNTIFKSENTVINDLNIAYVVDTDAKGTYNFHPSNIVLSHKNTGGIVLQTVSGDVYTCKGNSFRQQVSAGNCDNVTIQVEKMEKSTSTKELVDNL